MKKLITTLLIATTISNASVCSEITTKVDDFTGAISKTHPLDFSNSGMPMMIVKHIEGTSAKYSLILGVKGSDVHAGMRNVEVKFFDGTVYSFKNANVNIRYSNGYLYQTLISLNKEEVLLLMGKKIQKYRLAIYHRDVIPEESIRFNDFVNCLTAVEKG